MFTFSVVVVDLPTDCILSFLFPAETDLLVPVFSQSIDVVVMNFVVVPKFAITGLKLGWTVRWWTATGNKSCAIWGYFAYISAVQPTSTARCDGEKA